MSDHIPSIQQLEAAVRNCAVMDERTYLHLALPLRALVGVNVRRVHDIWEYRGARMRLSDDPAGAAALLAVLTAQEGDQYLDLCAAPASWVKPHRSGVTVHNFGEELVLGLRPSSPQLSPQCAPAAEVTANDAVTVLRQLVGAGVAAQGDVLVVEIEAGTLTVPYQQHSASLSLGVSTHDILSTADRRSAVDGWSIVGVSRSRGVPVALHLASGVTALVTAPAEVWEGQNQGR